jgi:hypothetical protein
VLKYLDGTIKALNFNIGKRNVDSIACMEWVPPDANDLREKLLLGTAEGEVLLLEVSCSFHSSPVPDISLNPHSSESTSQASPHL